MSLVPKAIATVKDAHINLMIKDETARLGSLDTSAPDYKEQLAECMKRIDTLMQLRKELARSLGERVIVPRR